MLRFARRASIARFIASTHGLMGASAADAGKIDSIWEALKEVKDPAIPYPD